MKRIYVIIGGLILIIGLIAVSLSHWNAKIDTTTEKAKEKIEATAKKDPSLTGDTPVNSTDSTKGTTAAASNQSDQTQTSDTPAKSNSNATANTVNNESSNGNPSGGSTPAAAGKTVADIKAAYQKIFSDLEVQEMSNIDQLVVQAKADYVSKKLSKADIAVKYQDAATVLESNADKTFNLIYQNLEFDLKKYGYDTNEAAEFKNEYQTKKQERLLRVINQVQSF